MFGCFDFTRKKSQREDFSNPTHKDFFFGDQNDVDDFVDHYTETSVPAVHQIHGVNTRKGYLVLTNHNNRFTTGLQILLCSPDVCLIIPRMLTSP